MENGTRQVHDRFKGRLAFCVKVLNGSGLNAVDTDQRISALTNLVTKLIDGYARGLADFRVTSQAYCIAHFAQNGIDRGQASLQVVHGLNLIHRFSATALRLLTVSFS